jgi:hypothetical protein
MYKETNRNCKRKIMEGFIVGILMGIVLGGIIVMSILKDE